MTAPRTLPVAVRARMLARLLVVQGAWSYDAMIAVGIAYAVEPALRLLPGGPQGEAYRAAVARQSAYFNCHPYMASLAAGALARVELDGEDPARIERFRNALCGPLGSVGDRLVWAAWLPGCSLFGLAVWGVSGSPLAAVLAFLLTYNVGHAALRLWGLSEGWERGLRVSQALGAPVLRDGPTQVARAASVCAGLALPLLVGRLAAGDRGLAVPALVFAVTAGYVLARLHGRVHAWAAALGLLLLVVLLSVLP